MQNMKVKYIVEFQNGIRGKYWLARWTGDPGRTIVPENAKLFNSYEEAASALNKAKTDNPHRKLIGVVKQKCIINLLCN